MTRKEIYTFIRNQPDTFIDEHVEDFISYCDQFVLCFNSDEEILEEFFKFVKIRKQIEIPE